MEISNRGLYACADSPYWGAGTLRPLRDHAEGYPFDPLRHRISGGLRLSEGSPTGWVATMSALSDQLPSVAVVTGPTPVPDIWQAAGRRNRRVDGVLLVLYRGFENHLCFFKRDEFGNWSGPHDDGGTVLSDPAVVQVPGSDLLLVFYQGAGNDGLVFRSLDPTAFMPGEVPYWNPEQPLLGNCSSLGAPVAVQVPGTETLQVFYAASDLSVRSRSLTAGTWSSEQNLTAGVRSSDTNVGGAITSQLAAA